MHLTATIIYMSWAIFFLYWFVSSFNVKKTVKVRLGFGNLRGYILVAFLIYLALRFVGIISPSALACRVDWAGCHADLFRNAADSPLVVQIISAIFSIFGLAVAVSARRTLGRNWSGAVVLKEGHELITHGVYRYMRHPIYAGIILMMLGAVLFINQPSVYFMTVILLILLWYKLSQEEKLMMETFPKDYASYKKRTKALIPYML